MFKSNKVASLSTFALVMLITGAIDNIRNLPATALFGSSLIFFFIFSAIVFLIPIALVSAELSSAWKEEGGIYHWVKKAFGEKIGFLAIWLQWINTMVWFPSILSFIAGTLSYLIVPSLAQNKYYLIAVILGTFWFLTLINLKGLHISTKFTSICSVVGLLIPMTLFVILAIIWVVMGKPLQIHFTSTDLFPSLKHSANWISLTAIITAFLGMELATVHVNEIKDPQKTFPKALYVSVLLVLGIMIFGALAIALVLPANQINLVNGVMQAFTNFFAAYHMAWLIPVMTVMILIGSFGNIISWVISPAKGLLQAAKTGFLPPFLKKENKYGVASNLLILQAILVSLFCLAFLLMPSINGSYWLLTDLSTQVYVLMYVFMLLAAVSLRRKFKPQPGQYTIPGGKFGLVSVCILGLIGCIITLIIGFFPPDGINVGGLLHYEIMFIGGLIAMILPVVFFYFYKRYKSV